MKFAITLSAVLLATQASANALPLHDTTLEARAAVVGSEIDTLDSLTEYSPLEKRKGGGGRGGGSSGGSSSSSSSSGSSSGGSRSGSGSSGSSGSGSGGGAAAGTRTSSPATFGAAGNSYRGGARSPYAAGGRTPRGIAPVFLVGAAFVGIGAAGALAYGAYRYDLDRARYYNETARRTQTSRVNCFCARYNPCSCDGSDDIDGYVRSLIGNGSYAAMQENKVTKFPNNTLYIDGTLDNDTSTSAASNNEDQGNAAFGTRGALEQSMWVAFAAVVGVAAWAM